MVKFGVEYFYAFRVSAVSFGDCLKHLFYIKDFLLGWDFKNIIQFYVY